MSLLLFTDKWIFCQIHVMCHHYFSSGYVSTSFITHIIRIDRTRDELEPILRKIWHISKIMQWHGSVENMGIRKCKVQDR